MRGTRKGVGEEKMKEGWRGKKRKWSKAVEAGKMNKGKTLQKPKLCSVTAIFSQPVPTFLTNVVRLHLIKPVLIVGV